MSETETTPRSESHGPKLAKSMTAGLLFFYVLGDVLGSGIYALIGLVADEVGGAFWTAFALGVGVALITGLAYAELVTRYPVAAGAALYIKKAFRNEFFTFVVTFCMLAAIVTASGALALTFGGEYFKEFLDWPTTIVAVGFVAVLSFINYRGISETAKTNAVMTFIELTGLLIIIVIGITTVLTGDANYGAVVDFKGDGNIVLAILGGAALSFFAMTGFENAANVAEETQNAVRVFPKALLGGMAVAGLLYVLVAISTSLVASYESVAGSEGALLEVVRQGPLAVPTWIFALIALIAVTNTCLVTMVTQSRILYGMAQEGAVPEVFAKVHPKRRTPWVGILFTFIMVVGMLVAAGAEVETLASASVVFLLFIYGLVIVACLKLRRESEEPASFVAPTPLLYLGIAGNAGLLAYTVIDDPSLLVYCGILLAIGLVLWAAQHLHGRRKVSVSG
ncbi:MAG TPA: APC family permease [Nocardioides sp.]|uniref:APC family permease n=1 Tax=Nocardioides sp. TaxID=35761 RepID=UPI002D810DD2|nr:APC family permease [Nocardioides sp.]HET6652506.1 APC family permease [Nocardioides sp.]